MKKDRSVIFLIALIVLLAYAPPLFADVYSSAHFNASNPVINHFGGDAASASFVSVITGGEAVTGEATSSNFILRSGFAYYDAFSPASKAWRWYDDENNETPTASLADENVAPSDIDSGFVIKLRVTAKETAGLGGLNTKFKLQYSTASDFSDGAFDVTEKTDCSMAEKWCYADGAGADNSLVSTKTLSDADACAGSVGAGCGTHNLSGTSSSMYTHTANASAEYEFTILESGATPNTTYFFRLFDMDSGIAVPLDTGASYPSLVTGGTILSFSIDGLPEATTIGDVTTNIDTTSTAVPFGTLPIGMSRSGAHHLTVTTNATHGYQIYVIGMQGFLGSTGGEIPGVAGTNPAPTGWSSGCSESASGCYGYHTSAPVLGTGNTTRFAANDTYAQFDQGAREIAYSAGPVSAVATDMVYRVAAHSVQDAGDYSTNITYIVVPTF